MTNKPNDAYQSSGWRQKLTTLADYVIPGVPTVRSVMSIRVKESPPPGEGLEGQVSDTYQQMSRDHPAKHRRSSVIELLQSSAVAFVEFATMYSLYAGLSTFIPELNDGDPGVTTRELIASAATGISIGLIACMRYVTHRMVDEAIRNRPPKRDSSDTC